MEYKNFDTYVLRTPLFSFSKYKKLTSQESVSDDDLKNLCQDPIFKEAIYLASPSLFQSMEKWLNNESLEDKKLNRLRLSLLKYASRISSRCTPFGLFAGCAVGKFDAQTQIELEATKDHHRHTELDMNFLVALSQRLAEIDTIKQQVLFFPNTSIYVVRDQLRYVEYTYVNNSRKHQVSSVDHSEYLQEILNKAFEGATLKELAEAIVEEEIPFEDAYEFVGELVDSQLLISELEPSISGEPFFDQIIKTLQKLNGVQDTLKTLEDVQQKITQLDSQLGNTTEIYRSIEELLKTLDVEFNERFLFQTDMITRTKTNTLDRELLHGLKKAITFIRKITDIPDKTTLETFKSAFYKRFEEREVPLSKALDLETGINYYPNNSSGVINPLVDDLVLRPNHRSNQEIQWSPVDRLFQEKIMEAYKTNAYSIHFKEEEIKDLDLKENPLPDTFSLFTEVVESNGEQKLMLKAGGGASAASILGRFCQGNKPLHEYVKQIVDVEAKINKDKLMAEILHLPESRVGNVLKRPDLREFEIPYLSKSNKPRTNQLTIDDLMISAPLDQKVVLRSKKHGKEVVPKLTNAHNFTMNPLPIYHFLSEMQYQKVQGGLSFIYGPFQEDYEFLPRLEYQNVILHKATWNLSTRYIKELIAHNDHAEKLLSETAKLRSKWQLPQFVSLADGDNLLLINLENSTSIQMLLAEVKKRKKFKLIEFLFHETGLAKHQEEYYTNEVIVSFFNQKKWTS